MCVFWWVGRTLLIPFSLLVYFETCVLFRFSSDFGLERRFGLLLVRFCRITLIRIYMYSKEGLSIIEMVDFSLR
jgi:hypothetical protein